jgi:hypothetical protein
MCVVLKSNDHQLILNEPTVRKLRETLRSVAPRVALNDQLARVLSKDGRVDLVVSNDQFVVTFALTDEHKSQIKAFCR